MIATDEMRIPWKYYQFERDTLKWINLIAGDERLYTLVYEKYCIPKASIRFIFNEGENEMFQCHFTPMGIIEFKRDGFFVNYNGLEKKALKEIRKILQEDPKF
ncbi:MAG TPA: hypothetical protein HA284_02435 [Nanoarchaeota archaeon]|nr:MAG: hypothetical protein QJ16_C0002G0030 [archaeon GW2011_AR1]HIH52371.1 hypothetical protein [Nanoarchaeota archaeon]